MKCKDCELFKFIGDTDKTGQGICGEGWDWQPVNIDNECVFLPKEYRCKDCQHYIDKDYTCITANADDLVNGCCGFEDARFYLFIDILIEWKLRGFNLDDKIKEAIKEVNDTPLPKRKDD